MLERLSIENYALIQQLELELSPSLNIITGETGAGKSILLGALGLIMGNRADTAVLKDSGRNCVIEGLFDMGSKRFSTRTSSITNGIPLSAASSRPPARAGLT